MNERIKELALQAWQRTNEQVSSQKSHMPDTVISQDDISDIFEEKFSQLIIEECIQLVVSSQHKNTIDKYDEYFNGFNKSLIFAQYRIQQHFGVNNESTI